MRGGAYKQKYIVEVTNSLNTFSTFACKKIQTSFLTWKQKPTKKNTQDKLIRLIDDKKAWFDDIRVGHTLHHILQNSTHNECKLTFTRYV